MFEVEEGDPFPGGAYDYVCIGQLRRILRGN